MRSEGESTFNYPSNAWKAVLRFVSQRFSLAALFFAAFSVSGYEYQISGTVSFEQFHEDGRTETEPDYHFEISVKDCKWFLRMVMQKTAGYYYPFDYQDVSWDEDYLYYVASTETEVKERRQRGEKVGVNVATAWTYNTPILHTSHAHQFGIIWLAYASACYFENVHADRVEPVVVVGLSTGVYPERWKLEQKAEWNLLSGVPPVPKHVIYFDDGMVRSAFAASDKPVSKRPPPYDEGYTNAIYRVLTFEKVDKLLLPKRAVLETFIPKRIAASNKELRLINRYTLEAARFSAICNVSFFVPRLPGNTVISDARLVREVRPFSYLSEKWLSEAKARHTDGYRRQTGSAPSVPSRVMLTVMVCLILGPVLFRYLRRTNRSTTQP